MSHPENVRTENGISVRTVEKRCVSCTAYLSIYNQGEHCYPCRSKFTPKLSQFRFKSLSNTDSVKWDETMPEIRFHSIVALDSIKTMRELERLAALKRDRDRKRRAKAKAAGKQASKPATQTTGKQAKSATSRNSK